MTGTNGTGGNPFFLELRAVWTDEGEKFSSGFNRIFFLVRYEDSQIDRLPDQLAYATRDPLTGELKPSPIPTNTEPGQADSVVINPANWTRLNQDGTEDAVMLLIAEVDPEASSELVNLNKSVIGHVGNVIEPTSGLPMSNVDLWIWRAGRTNLQPVPQYTKWDFFENEKDAVPTAEYPGFDGTAGFAEDGWIGPSNNLMPDVGPAPYVRNWGGNNPPPVPERLAKCEEAGRGDEQQQIQNGGLPKDIVCWDAESKVMNEYQTEACQRPSGGIWSKGLAPGEFDYVQGWRIRVPFIVSKPEEVSARDVRARGAYGTTQEKGYPVETVEFMRALDTGNPDDLRIAIDKDPQSPTYGRPPNRYRMVIAVFDGSNRIASGSTEIFLQFQPPTPYPGPVNRCQ